MKKNVVLGIIIAVAGLVLWGCSNGTSSTTKTYTVRYEVTGTGEVTEADISYHKETAGTEQIGIVPLPWEQIITVTAEKNSYHIVECQATKANKNDEGSLTATLYIDNKEVQTDSTETEDSVTVGVTIGLTYN